MYSKETLKNGLTILKVPILSAKSVIVDIFVKTGSRQEEKRINGISHFLEHLFFKGSRRYPTAQALAHALDAIGAVYNANTGKEHTQFYIKAAKKHFQFIFEILTDMLQNPVFAREEIEREKGVIIEEINMYEDTPMRHVENVLEEIMWPAHPLGRNIAGSKAAVRKMQRADILNYVSTYYQPRNMILAVAGAYSEKELQKKVAKFWGNYPSKKFPSWQKVRHGQNRSALKMESKKTEQFHLALGFRSYHHNHPRYIPQVILATILGGGMSSRLFTEIRERRGWAYYITSVPTNYQDTGNFVIQAGVRLDVLTEVIATVLQELQKIKTKLVPRSELVKAKEYLKGTLTLSLEASESLLAWYLEQAAFRKKILEPEEMLQLIEQIRATDIQQVAQEIFQARKLSLAIVGPPEAPRAKIQKLLQV